MKTMSLESTLYLIIAWNSIFGIPEGNQSCVDSAALVLQHDSRRLEVRVGSLCIILGERRRSSKNAIGTGNFEQEGHPV